MKILDIFEKILKTLPLLGSATGTAINYSISPHNWLPRYNFRSGSHGSTVFTYNFKYNWTNLNGRHSIKPVLETIIFPVFFLFFGWWEGIFFDF